MCSVSATERGRSTRSRKSSARGTTGPTFAQTWATSSRRSPEGGCSSMPTPNPLLLIAELSYRCPLHCPYCSNPLEIGEDRYRDELTTDEWSRVFRESSALGVLQLALTGGEPLVRRDVEELARVSADSGLYSTLVTAGTPFTPKRARALREAGLDHVQVSIQDSDPPESDRI